MKNVNIVDPEITLETKMQILTDMVVNKCKEFGSSGVDQLLELLHVVI
jgi:hypothetical protein